MLTDLGDIITLIQCRYDRLCSMYNPEAPEIPNLKKTCVAKFRSNMDMLNTVWYYRGLLNDEFISIMFDLSNMQRKTLLITSRVKAQNSIEYKLDNYTQNHEHGEIPVNKCLNDLFGIRVVIDDDFCTQDVMNYMYENYSSYKCINSSKGTYEAVHIYFSHGNHSFPWELQVWNKSDELNNYNSHKEYKQGYTAWEHANKEVTDCD